MTNDLRIADAPLLADLSGEEKLPTGGYGNYSTTINQIADFTQLKFKLATESYVDDEITKTKNLLETHSKDDENPHNVKKEQIGLGEVDNTADTDKPVSTYQKLEIDTRVAKTSIVDNLTTDDVTKVLSAKQGKVLQDNKVDKTEVKDALDLKADKTDVNTALDLKANKTDVSQQLSLKEDKTNKGVAGGYASLDENKKVPVDQLPISSLLDADGWQIEPNMLIKQWGQVVLPPIENYNSQTQGGQTYYTQYYSIAFPISFNELPFEAQTTLMCSPASSQTTQAGLSIKCYIESKTTLTVAVTSYFIGYVPYIYWQARGV